MAKKSDKLQSALTMDRHTSRLQHLREAGPQVAHRIDTHSVEGAVMITAIPKCDGDTLKEGELMRGLIRTRLGLSIPYIVPGPCLCRTRGGGCYVDKYGFHLCSDCIEGNLRQVKHNSMADVFVALSRQTGKTVRREQNLEIKAVDENSKMRIDLTIPNYVGTDTLGVEVSIVDVRASTYSKSPNIMVAGKAASDRELAKMKKYRDVFQAEGYRCEPLVVEAGGRFGDRTREFFDEMCRLAHENTGLPLSYLKHLWRTRIVWAMLKTASVGTRQRMREVERRRAAKSAPKGDAQGRLLEDFDFHGYSRARYASPQGK
jgi:hypothetical protein